MSKCKANDRISESVGKGLFSITYSIWVVILFWTSEFGAIFVEELTVPALILAAVFIIVQLVMHAIAKEQAFNAAFLLIVIIASLLLTLQFTGTTISELVVSDIFFTFLISFLIGAGVAFLLGFGLLFITKK